MTAGGKKKSGGGGGQEGAGALSPSEQQLRDVASHITTLVARPAPSRASACAARTLTAATGQSRVTLSLPQEHV